MKILVAGATGAIGRALISQLLASGETVIGMARSTDAERQLSGIGAEVVHADALDAASVHIAVTRIRPDVIINELTSLPQRYTAAAMKAAAERDRTVRVQGNQNLLSAAAAVGVRRYILQSSAFFYAPGPGLATEEDSLAVNASPAIAASSQTYTALEQTAFGQSVPEVVSLRYGFFYGPGTWYTREGDVAEQIRQRQIPVIGEGQGLWNYIHIDDAADATVAALRCAPGVYNVVDDQPYEQRAWLPAFARYLGAPEPPRISEEQAIAVAGLDLVYYATRLRGASNGKAKREWNFQPRTLEWLST